MNRVLCVLAAMVLATSLHAQQSVMVSAAKDNTLYFNSQGARSNGSGTGIFSGRTNSGSRRRAVLAFDLLGAVPTGATVVSASLQLTMDMTISGPVDIGLHTVSQDWGEGSSFATGGGGAGTASSTGDATWLHTFFSNQFWTTAGGDFNATASATTPVGSVGQYTWSSAQLVSDVQGWVNNPGSNFGWLLKSPENSIGTAKRFASREFPNASDRPVLIIGFSASATPSGTGCTIVTGGTPFSLGSVGVPSIPNPSFALTITNAHSQGIVSIYLAQGLASFPLPVGNGCSIYLDPASALALEAAGLSPIGPLPLSPAGTVTLPVPLPNIPSLVGQSLDLQALSISLATGSFATSNALTLMFL